MSMILVKMPVRPDRQRVLVGEEGDETDMKLRQWANKKAFAEGLGGEAAATRRDELMREAITDPSKHGLTFMDKPIPFDEEGEEKETHTMPDGTEMEGASHEEAIGEEGDAADKEIEQMHRLEEELTHGKDESEIDRDEVQAQIEAAMSSAAKPTTPASKPLPTGQTTLEDFAPKSFDPHPGDAMLKAVRARMGW
jgi:hypothetical protein